MTENTNTITVSGLLDDFDPSKAYNYTTQEILANWETKYPDFYALHEEELREGLFEKIIAMIRENHPDQSLYRIILKKYPNELFVGRETSWQEYKQKMAKQNAATPDAMAMNEDLVTAFLVYPKAKKEWMSACAPGKLVSIAGQITRAIGFGGDGDTAKKI